MYTKSLLQQQAYDYIKNKILSGEFQPDKLYSETKLSSEIGISRTPMREALQCLSQDGYITIVPSKGFQIRHLNEKDMLETIQVRCAIEGFCTSTIAPQIDTPKGRELLSSLDIILNKMRTCVESAQTSSDALAEFIEYDNQFHLKLVEYVENDEFRQLYQRLMYMIRLTSTSELSSKKERIQGTLDEHDEYYNALKSGNSHNAYTILRDHLLMPMQA
jgi:DNA-binding GntR family transcriptional regulator